MDIAGLHPLFSLFLLITQKMLLYAFYNLVEELMFDFFSLLISMFFLLKELLFLFIILLIMMVVLKSNL